AAFRRLLGPRQAERLAVSGKLLAAEEALAVGLVDEVVAPDGVVPRAVELCAGLLALPPLAMSSTREQARADLVALFSDRGDPELGGVLESWFSAETQTTLRGLVAKLAQKRAAAAS